MNDTLNVTGSTDSEKKYDAPELTLVGTARDVVLGMPGSGFDGPYGMTEPQFEFETDDEPR